MVTSDDVLTSSGAAACVRYQRLDDAVHGASAGHDHHGLLVVVLTNILPDAVYSSVSTLHIAVRVRVAVLIADTGKLCGPRTGHFTSLSSSIGAIHLLPLLRLVS